MEEVRFFFRQTTKGDFMLYLIEMYPEEKMKSTKLRFTHRYNVPIKFRKGTGTPIYPKFVNKEEQERYELALQLKAKRLKELRALRLGLSIPKENKPIRFFEYWQEYEKSKKSTTYYFARKALEPILGKETLVRTINPSTLDKAFKQMLKTNREYNTCCIYFDRMRIVWNSMLKDDITIHNPFNKWRSPKKRETKTTFLEPSEVKQLEEYSVENPSIVLLAFLFGCYTGLRYSDQKQLKWSDIDGEILRKRQKKSNTMLQVYLSKKAISIIERIENHSEYIFNGLPYNSSYNSHLKKVVKAVGINKKVTAHCARHTYGVEIQSKGKDIYKTSKAMGHASIRDTTRYAKVKPVDLKETTSKIFIE